MNKNNIYLGIFAALLLVYLLVKFVLNTAPESNVDMTILQIDTAQISSIHILQTKKKLDLKLEKSNEQWFVSQENKKYKADKNTIKALLTTLGSLKIENIASTKDEPWKEFQLTDSLATEVQLFDKDGKIIKDLLIGKFNYKPQQGNQSMYGRQSRVQGSSYIRLADQKMSYLVNGFLSMTFGRDLDSYRNKSLLNLNPADITKVEFQYPADTGFILQKADSSQWLVQKDTADFKTIQSYLKALSNYRERSFENNVKLPTKSSSTILISGKNFEPIQLHFYEKDSLNYIVHSSQNEEGYFHTPKKNSLRRILKSKSAFNK